jgi:hypothetical protein
MACSSYGILEKREVYIVNHLKIQINLYPTYMYQRVLIILLRKANIWVLIVMTMVKYHSALHL